MKENKKAKKVVALLLCAVLLVVGSVSATVAYLTDSAAVKNTFTVGKVDIELDEAKVTEYGVKVNPEVRVVENTYKLIPGHTYVKDPTITVKANSEKCYLFVEVDNGLKAIIDAITIENQIVANSWTQKEVNGNKTIFQYNNEVASDDEDQKIIVFENFKLTVDANVANYDAAEITVKACAVQVDGLDASDALTEAKNKFNSIL